MVTFLLGDQTYTFHLEDELRETSKIATQNHAHRAPKPHPRLERNLSRHKHPPFSA